MYKAGESGPAVFVVGGLQGLPLLETPLARMLEAAATFGARVSMMDIAGAGNSRYAGKLTLESMLEDIAEVYLRHVGRPAVWIGASLGGWLMLLLHRRNPEWFLSMCALAPAIDWDQHHLIPQRAAGAFRETAEGIHLHGLVMPRELLESMAAHRLGGAPFALRCSLQVIHGDADAVAPITAVDAFVAHVGSACRLEKLPQEGHEVSKLGSPASLDAFARWLRAAIDREGAAR